MRCLKLTSMGGQAEWLVPGEGMKFWVHVPGETRIAFPERDNYSRVQETPEQIVAKMALIEADTQVRIEGMESVLERLDYFQAERERKA